MTATIPEQRAPKQAARMVRLGRSAGAAFRRSPGRWSVAAYSRRLGAVSIRRERGVLVVRLDRHP